MQSAKFSNYLGVETFSGGKQDIQIMFVNMIVGGNVSALHVSVSALQLLPLHAGDKSYPMDIILLTYTHLLAQGDSHESIHVGCLDFLKNTPKRYQWVKVIPLFFIAHSFCTAFSIEF